LLPDAVTAVLIAGVFSGVEIILREFAADALFTVMLSAVVADVIAIPFLGDKPFLSGFPAGITLGSPRERRHLVVAVGLRPSAGC
jgi:chloride channel protein, CIC family